MVTAERDKFLTEAIGGCDHVWKLKPGFNLGHHCIKCDKYWPMKPTTPLDVVNFSTWPGFGKLWAWAIGQVWWINFIDKSKLYNGYESESAREYEFKIINPDRFATAIYEYLKEK